MKILVIAEAIGLNSSEGICTNKFLMCVAKAGHEVHCIYSDSVEISHHTWLNGVQLIKRVNKPWRLNNIFQKITVQLYKLTNIKVQDIAKYISGFSFAHWHEAALWREAIKAQIAKAKPDLIFVRSRGANFRTHTAMLGMDTDIPWIANYHDPFPFSQYPPPYQWYDAGWKKQEKINAAILQKAPLITVPSIRLKEWITSFHPQIKDKIHHLPHAALSFDYFLSGDEKTRIKQLPNQLSLLHAGNLLGGHRRTDVLVQALARFFERYPEAKARLYLHIVGGSLGNLDGYPAVKNNIVEYDRVSYADSLQMMQQAQVLLLLEAASEHSPFMPGKLADYLQADKPILALTPPNSETARLFGSTYPYMAPADDLAQITQAIESLWKDYMHGNLQIPPSKVRNMVIEESLVKVINDIFLLALKNS
jgi:hypothetical protein